MKAHSIRLRESVIEGNLAITKRLLYRFPELWLNTDEEHQGWTNLHYASYYGNYLTCIALVTFVNNSGGYFNEYSKIDMITFDELTVLHLCVMNRHAQTLQYLLQEFPGEIWINYKGGEKERTPLHFCCVYGFSDGIKLLLEYGALWDIQDVDGNTCLHLCFENGNEDCLQEFLKHLMIHAPSKADMLERLEEFQSVKNSRNLVAIDCAYSFDMVKNFKFLKQELNVLNQELGDSNTLVAYYDSHSSIYSEANASSTSLPENKVLASPILSMSQQNALFQDEIVDPNKYFENGRSEDVPTQKLRIHSHTITGTDMKNDKNKSIDSRKRSNTQSNSYRPPSLSIGFKSGSRADSSPRTPIMAQSVTKPPSIKSVTISPSVRGTGNSRSTRSSISLESGNQISPTLNNSQPRNMVYLYNTNSTGSSVSVDVGDTREGERQSQPNTIVSSLQSDDVAYNGRRYSTLQFDKKLTLSDGVALANPDKIGVSSNSSNSPSPKKKLNRKDSTNGLTSSFVEEETEEDSSKPRSNINNIIFSSIR